MVPTHFARPEEKKFRFEMIVSSRLARFINKYFFKLFTETFLCLVVDKKMEVSEMTPLNFTHADMIKVKQEINKLQDKINVNRCIFLFC